MGTSLIFLLCSFLLTLSIYIYIYIYLSVCVDVGLGGMNGRTIALDQVCGKEQEVGRSYLSVAVMMTRPQQILR